MTIIPCDYWHEEDGGCNNCPADYWQFCDGSVFPVEKDDLIENLTICMKNIQKMLDRLQKL